MLNVCDGESPRWSTGGGRGDRVESRMGVVEVLSAGLVVYASMMQVTSGMTPRGFTEQGHKRGLGCEGHHVVCVKGEGPPYHRGVKGKVLV